ncbi:MAG: hypothetical protein ABEJ35_00315 [Halobacteriaceae archaeon]
MALDGSTALSRELAALKRQGASLLVVGDGGVDAAVCPSLLGERGADRRGLFLATTVGSADVRARWTGPETASTFGVVDVTGTRGPQAQVGASLGDPGVAAGDSDWYERAAIDDPDAIVAAVKRGVNRLAADDPPPATLRFCLDSVDPLLDALPSDRLFTMLTTLTGVVKEVGGMAHVHASPALPTETRRTLEPLFDATIEVEQTEPGTHRQRWHLHEADVETEWLTV